MPVSARYWRIRATADSYGSSPYTKSILLQALEFYASSDASGTPHTPSGAVASSAATPAANAIDGSLATYWLTGPSMPTWQWIRLDMGISVAVGSMRLYHFDSVHRLMQEGVIEYSANDTDWTPIATITPADLSGVWQSFTDIQAGGSIPTFFQHYAKLRR